MPRTDAIAQSCAVTRRTRERDGRLGALDLAAVIAEGVPTILKGAVRDWPLVRAGLKSAESAEAYLRRFDAGKPLVCYTGAPEIGGRFHYNAAVTAMNFRGERATLSAFLEAVAAERDAAHPASRYIGSTDLDLYFPGFRSENDVAPADDLFADHPPIASIWIGNRTTAAAHYDMANNAGRWSRWWILPPPIWRAIRALPRPRPPAKSPNSSLAIC